MIGFVVWCEYECWCGFVGRMWVVLGVGVGD